MGRKYIMRKVVSFRETGFGYFFKLECGHEVLKFNSPSTSVTLFMLSDQNLKDRARFGCFECGENEDNANKPT